MLSGLWETFSRSTPRVGKAYSSVKHWIYVQDSYYRGNGLDNVILLVSSKTRAFYYFTELEREREDTSET